MKKFAKFLLCTLLIAVSCTALLVGCQTTEDKLQNSPLIGTWVKEAKDNEEAQYWIIEYDPEYSIDTLKRTAFRATLTTLGYPTVVEAPLYKLDINDAAFKVSGDTLTVTSSLSGNVSVYKRTSQTLEDWENAYTSN